ncbi:MAG: zinc/iron-chelating domain-containing protein [Flavobacteriales bacterium]|nr:zinc/iron-chelating domain-containing protein [Flavobacteriales bacterium]
MDLKQHQLDSQRVKKENVKFFKQLQKVKPKVLDKYIHRIHEETFSCIDCLQCANCCSTTGPLFTDKDISRIAKYLSIKPSDFTEQFLHIDEDNDYVLQSVPCTFLDADNQCSIYHVRPKACREYPHTNRIKQHQLLKLTEKNVSICPAVFQIVEKLKNQLK